ncbi:MAG: inositol monophosphatase family protein [Alphaproteobacteria bacterium]
MDIDAVAEIIREVAVAEILPRFGTLQAHEIRSKTHPGDLVTEADLQTEFQLTRRLTDLLPGSVVVGEESVHHDRRVLERLTEEAPVWVLDPVDGTGNFAHGRTSFGVIVSLVTRKEIVAGWIHDPIKNITLRTEVGAGVWRGTDRLRLPPPPPLSQMVATLGNRESKTVGLAIHHLVRNASAAQDYLGLVQGEVHFSHYIHLMPWDHAAGVLMHAEAGGYSAMVGGEPYQPLPNDGAILLAPDKPTWDVLLPLVTSPA